MSKCTIALFLQADAPRPLSSRNGHQPPCRKPPMASFHRHGWRLIHSESMILSMSATIYILFLLLNARWLRVAVAQFTDSYEWQESEPNDH
jgi:hypothetical protein